MEFRVEKQRKNNKTDRQTQGEGVTNGGGGRKLRPRGGEPTEEKWWVKKEQEERS